MGCLTISTKRLDPLHINVGVVCGVGETYEIFNASDGEFFLADGSLMYVLRKNVIN